MRVNTMRWVDRNFGVPLCGLFSIAHAAMRLFRRKPSFHPPKKILFIALSEMGSLVLAYPLFQKTQAFYPDAELYFLTFDRNRAVLKLLGVFPDERILTINPAGITVFLKSSLKAVRRLRSRKIDTVLDLELFARSTALLSYFSGARYRVGYYAFNQGGLYRGNFLTRRVPYNPHIHIAQNFLSLIYALQCPEEIPPAKRKPDPVDLVPPQAGISDDLIKSVEEKLAAANPGITQAERIILINPNASDIIPIRRWPLENYIALAGRLQEKDGFYVVITGLLSERAEAEQIIAQLNSDRCVDFAGKTSFEELIALYHIADVLVTNDSGPGQFAALTPIKSVILFGPETPALYGPLTENATVLYSHFTCSPCVTAFNHRRTPCRNNRCLQAISVEAVEEAISAALYPSSK